MCPGATLPVTKESIHSLDDLSSMPPSASLEETKSNEEFALCSQEWVSHAICQSHLPLGDYSRLLCLQERESGKREVYLSPTYICHFSLQHYLPYMSPASLLSSFPPPFSPSLVRSPSLPPPYVFEEVLSKTRVRPPLPSLSLLTSPLSLPPSSLPYMSEEVLPET